MKYTLISFLDFLNFVPEIFFFFSILFLLLFLLVFSSSKNYKYPLILNSASWVSVYILSVLGILFYNGLYQNNGFFFNNLLNNYSLFYIKFFICISTILCILISIGFLRKEQINNFEYVILILLATFGSFIFVSSYDMKVLYLALEIQSLSLYILVTLKKNSLLSTESGLKYFVLGSLSSILLLFGFSILYSLTGTTNLYDISLLFSFESSYEYFALYLNIGLLFILVSFLFKLACVPFHMWAPDVYEGAPTSVSLYMSTIPKISFIVVCVKIIYIYFNSLFFNVQNFLVLISLLSISIGALLGIIQKRFKRLLIYSSISHVGFILFGISTSNSIDNLANSFVYLSIYLFITITVWCIYISLRSSKNKNSIIYINDLSSLIYNNSTLSFILLIILFSMAGIPPLIGFWIKYIILLSSMNSYFLFPSIFVLFFSAVSVFFYVRIVKLIYFNFNKFKINLFAYETINKENSLIISLFFLLTLISMFYPNIVFLLAYKITLFL